MADIMDQAGAVEELHRGIALKRRQPEGPAATGACHNCGATDLPAGHRWCDADCRDDWQAARARR